jgi:acetyltransferase
VVSDKVQKKGLGTKLMTALMDVARDRGLTSMEGTVLAENAPMLQLMRELGFSIRASEEEMAICVVERRL